MNLIKHLIPAAAALLLLAGCGKSADASFPYSISSPDGLLTVSVGITPEGTAVYELAREGRTVVAPSRLGFELTDGSDLLKGFVISGVEYGSADETWHPVWGEERDIRNCYNEIAVTFEQKPEGALAPQSGVSATDPEYTGDPGNPSAKGAVMLVRFRIYDDGLGFRYEFPLENKLR